MSKAYLGDVQVDNDQNTSGPCGQKRLMSEPVKKEVECGQISTQIVRQEVDQLPAISVLVQDDPDHQEPCIGGKG